MSKNDTNQKNYFSPSNLSDIVEKLNNSASPFRITLYTGKDDDDAAYGGFGIKRGRGGKELDFLRSTATKENYEGTSCTYILYDKETNMQVLYFSLRKIEVNPLQSLLLGGKVCIELSHTLVNNQFRLSHKGQAFEKKEKIGLSAFADFIDPIINEMAKKTGARQVFILVPRRYRLIRYIKSHLHFKSRPIAFLVKKVIKEREKKFCKYLYRSI